jgi:MFS family permease
MKGVKTFQNISTIRAVASTFGVLVGLAGIEHGIFEILQGNVKPDGLLIEAIGPSQRFWEHSSETALTIIPNMILSGVLAMIFGVAVTTWAAYHVDKKHGARVLMILSIILWLVGGGFAPVLMAIFAFIAASRIDRPLNWWRAHLRGFPRDLLARLWPLSILVFVVVFVAGVEIAIFGYPLLWFYNAEVTYRIQWALAYIMVIFWPLTILTAIAHDIQR